MKRKASIKFKPTQFRTHTFIVTYHEKDVQTEMGNTRK